MKKIFNIGYKWGMTLIELLVSISIFTIITSVVVLNHSEFNSNVLVTNLAYEVALAVRQAQTYGLSVKGVGVNYPFGVYVDTHGDQSFLIFGDKNNNGIFDIPADYSGSCTGVEDVGGDICEEKLTLRGDVKIESFCVFTSDINKHCGFSSNDINWSSILFKRPNPVALIYGNTFGTPPDQDPSSSGTDLGQQKIFEITIGSARANGKHKTIRVERTGQISVVQQ